MNLANELAHHVPITEHQSRLCVEGHEFRHQFHSSTPRVMFVIIKFSSFAAVDLTTYCNMLQEQ